ncbi:MAG: hypothetical protein IJL87_08405 [Clostridia bacterium]|nr:hypothetical protein [Clostridia bacterium]
MNSTPTVSLKFHIPLLTESKLFCSCPTAPGEPNANTCPICMGAFGVSPSLNRSAMSLAILVGLALNCSIGNKLVFDKMPCAPGCMPKGYRMAQNTAPIAKNGHIEILTPNGKKRITIRSCRLEEGYRTDQSDLFGENDYNRCGIPIMTIETSFCLVSGEEVKEALAAIISLLHFFGATASNYDSGDIIMEIRIAVGAQAAKEGGTRLYLKGSADDAMYAVDFEIGRQTGLLRSGGSVVCENITLDPETRTTVPYNGREFCFESRGGAAIRDASLSPAQIHELYMRAAASVIGELPSQKFLRYVGDFGIDEGFAKKISSERTYAFLFEYCAAKCLNIRVCARWIAAELDEILRIAGIPAYLLDIDPEKFAALMNMHASRLVGDDGCREILTQIIITGCDPFEYAAYTGLLLITDSETITIACRVAMRRNTDLLRAYLTGSPGAFDALVDAAYEQLNKKSDKDTIARFMEQEATCDFLAACDSGQIPMDAAQGSALEISTDAKGDRLIDFVDSIPEDERRTFFRSSTLSRYEVELLVKGIVDRTSAEVDVENAERHTEVAPQYVDARPFFPENSPMSQYFLHLQSPLPAPDPHYDSAPEVPEDIEMPDIDKMLEDNQNIEPLIKNKF